MLKPDIVREYAARGVSPEQIAKELGLKIQTVLRYMRKPRKRRSKKTKPTLVVGDVHAPFDHPSYPEFLLDTAHKYKTTNTVFIGDLVDNHAISRHVSEPDADGPQAEYEKCLEHVRRYTEAFPEAYLTLGNHDSIPQRQAKELGMPQVFLRDMHSMWELPETWAIAEHFILDEVLYKHGVGNAGLAGAYNACKDACMSSVQGHTHAFAGVLYHSNDHLLRFGLNAGCGIDVKAYAFRYGKYARNRPILGCGVVVSKSEAYFVPMDMKKYGRKV